MTHTLWAWADTNRSVWCLGQNKNNCDILYVVTIYMNMYHCHLLYFHCLISGMELSLQKFLELARQTEAFFLKKRLILSKQKPEQFIKDVSLFLLEVQCNMYFDSWFALRELICSLGYQLFFSLKHHATIPRYISISLPVLFTYLPYPTLNLSLRVFK